MRSCLRVYSERLQTVSVCVPARNEARLLPRLFAALAAQGDEVGPWSLSLLLDACTDDSAAVAERLAARAPFDVAIGTLPIAAPNAGRARAAAMRLGAARLPSGEGLLLTTDADSAPAADWIAAARAGLAESDVVVGRIVRRAGAGASLQELEAYYDRLYALRRRLDPVPWDPGPHHHFTGGANMAFRSDAYARLGGFQPVASGEDALIVDEAHRRGQRVRHDARMVVRTSSRRTGRAPGGVAGLIRSDPEPDTLRVAHPAAMAWQYAAQARARAYHLAPTPETAVRLARDLGVKAEALADLARDGCNAEGFATRVVPAPADTRFVGLAEAQRALSALERDLEGKAA